MGYLEVPVDKVKEILGSKKFWAMIAGVVTSAGAGFTGSVSSSEALAGVIGSIITYIYSVGQVDAAKAANPE